MRKQRAVLFLLVFSFLLTLSSINLPFSPKVEAQHREYLKIRSKGDDVYEFDMLSNDTVVFDSKNSMMYLPRWTNEAHFNITLGGDLRDKCKGGSKTVFYESDNMVVVQYLGMKKEVLFELRWYPLNSTDYEYGGVEYEVVVYDKTVFTTLLGKLLLPIDTAGLKFYYQPPLYEEHGFAQPYSNSTFFVNATHVMEFNGTDWITTGYRPENVVGSYAVYHATKSGHVIGQTNYATGKAFHIYRPLARDSAGNTTWCDLSIDEAKGLLTVTVPQEFLDKAVYPVTVDPTFGYTTIGASYVSFGSQIRGSVFTILEAGTAENITVYWCNTAASQFYVKSAIYLHSDSSKVGETAEVYYGTSVSAGWYTYTFSTPKPSLNANTAYVLVLGFQPILGNTMSVSYTHLTLPTSDLV